MVVATWRLALRVGAAWRGVAYTLERMGYGHHTHTVLTTSNIQDKHEYQMLHRSDTLVNTSLSLFRVCILENFFQICCPAKLAVKHTAIAHCVPARLAATLAEWAPRHGPSLSFVVRAAYELGLQLSVLLGHPRLQASPRAVKF